MVASLPRRWLWVSSRWLLHCLALAPVLARKCVRDLRRDRIGRVIAVVDVDEVAAAGHNHHTRLAVVVVVVVDSHSLQRLIVALGSRRIGPAIAIVVGSLWRGGWLGRGTAADRKCQGIGNSLTGKAPAFGVGTAAVVAVVAAVAVAAIEFAGNTAVAGCTL